MAMVLLCRFSQTATGIKMWGICCPVTPRRKQTTNTGFVDRRNRQKQSKEIEMYGRIHSDLCNGPRFVLPGVRLQIKFTKAKPSFYLMNTKADSTTVF
jgi:hypothetical protein